MSSVETNIRLLLVEDSEDDALLLLREMQKGGYEPDCLRVETEKQMRDALESREWDVIVCDYTLPGFGAPQALTLVKESGRDIPFIIYSGTIGEDAAVACVKNGAEDFVLKGHYVRLIPAIQRSMREAESRRGRLEAEEARHATEERYRNLIEQLPDALIVVRKGRIVFMNPAALELFGAQAPPQLLKEPIAQYLQVSAAGSTDTGSRTHLAQSIREGRLVRLDGKHIYVDVASSSFEFQGEPAEQLILRDITDRKDAQRQAMLQLEQLAALRKVDIAITGSLDLRLTLSVLLDQMTATLQMPAADVLLLDSLAQSLTYYAGRGFSTPTVSEASLRISRGCAGAAVQTRQTVIYSTSSARADDPRREVLSAENFADYMVTPLVSKAQVKGVLEVFSRAPIEPTTGWLELLDAFAGQAAIAIDNATLFESLQGSNAELELAYDTTLEGWSRALDLRDNETEGHTQRVTQLALQLGRKLGLAEAELTQVRRGALLHDIGKMGIPDQILLKPGTLTESEWEVMRMHPVYAYEMLRPIAYLKRALFIPYEHHEKWDGSGYPRGLRGNEISLAARIFAVADVWDAITSKRPYREPMTREEAREHIIANRGTHFDPYIVDIFLEML